MYESLFRYKAGGEEGALAFPGSGEATKRQENEFRQAGLIPFVYQEHDVVQPDSGSYESDNEKSVANIDIPA